MNIELSLDFLEEITGLKNGKLSAAVKQDDDNFKSAEEIEKVIKTAISEKLKSVRKEGHDEGHGRGKRESLSSLEETLVSKYNVTGDGIESIVASIHEKAAQKSGNEDLTPEQIKKSDVFINAVKAEIDKREQIASQFEEFKTGVTQERNRAAIKSKLTSVLKERNFALPESEKVRKRLLDAYVDEVLDTSTVEVGDDGIKITSKDGKPHRDSNFNELSLEDYGASIASEFFEVSDGKDRRSTGAGTQGSGGTGGGGFPVVKSQEDFIRHYRTLDDFEKKKAFKEHFDKLKEAGKIEN